MIEIALAALLAAVQDPALDEKEVLKLVEKLNADDVAQRAQAEADLMALGEGVVPHLEKARPGAPAEARARIDSILQEVTLARRWVKDLAEEDDPSNAYRRLEEAFKAKTLDRKQLVRIVSAAFQSESVNENLRQYMFSLVDRHKMREIWPALVQLVAREDPDGRSNAISYLQRLRPPKEAADEILKLLVKTRNRSSSMQLLELALSLKPDKAKLDAAVQALLDSEADEDTRTTVLGYISQGRLQVSLGTALRVWRAQRPMRNNAYTREAILRTPPDESVKDVVALLSSSELDEVVLAADYAARHRVAAAAVPLVEALQRQSREGPSTAPLMVWAGDQYYNSAGQVRGVLVRALRALNVEEQARGWLKGEGPPSRAAVLALAGELEIKSLAGEVAACLDDKDPALRREAAKALGALRHEESAPKLEARLKDEIVAVRREALSSIARIRGAAATPIVLDQLRSENPDIQAAAVGLLPSMDLEAVLDELTREPTLGRPYSRYALAVVMVNGGELVTHRVMARVGGKIPASELTDLVRLVQAARGR
jgi:HEAT repeat protein